MANKSLSAAKEAKKDEFYTQLEDINKELKYYREHFRGKTVLCNCDDPRISNFFTYFAYNFEFLGLKRLITTCYKNQDADLFSQNKSEQAIYLIYDGDKNGNHIPDAEEIGIHPLKGDGDFRSRECIELLKQADIVVTNPPFSLFREYVAQLMEYEKKFIIIGNVNAVSYKEIFPLIKDNKLWMGQSIKIKIAGNEYPLVASSPEMERLMRLAAEAINQKLTAYDAKFPNKSLSDKLSFVALNETVSRLTYQKRLSDASEEAKGLQEDVETYLKNIEKDGR